MRAFIFIIMFLSIKAYSQDTITVVFHGIRKGESYIVYNRFKKIGFIKYKNTRYGDYELKIDVSSYKEGDFMSIEIYRRGFLSLGYKNTSLSVKFMPNKPYLLLFRDRKLKNRYALTPEWRDIPFKEK